MQENLHENTHIHTLGVYQSTGELITFIHISIYTYTKCEVIVLAKRKKKKRKETGSGAI